MQNDRKKLLTKMIVSFLAVGSLYYCGALDRDCFAGAPANSQTGNDTNGEVTFDPTGGYEYVFGRYLDSGDVEKGHVTISEGSTTLKGTYGGFTENGNANNNTVTVNGGPITMNVSNIYGGYSSNGSATDNKVEIGNNGNIKINGGVIDIVGAQSEIGVENNEVVINNSDIANNSSGINNLLIHGARTNNGVAADNKVIIDNMNSNTINDNRIYGAQVSDNKKDNISFNNNSVKITNSNIKMYPTLKNYICGINIIDNGNNNNISNNSIIIEKTNIVGNSSSIETEIIGAYVHGNEKTTTTVTDNTVTLTDVDANRNAKIYGAISTQGVANDNKVTLTNVTADSTEIYGASNEYEDAVIKDNTVTIAGDKTAITGNSNIYGGYNGGEGSVIGNTVDIQSGSKIEGNVYGGYSEIFDNLDSGEVSGNTIKLRAGANVEKADLYGANDDVVQDEKASNNSLDIDGFSGTVNSLHNFDNVNFGDIDFAKDDIEITSTEQSDLSNANLNVNFTTNGKIYDKGEVQQITLNNINIGSEGTKNSGDVIKEKTDGNGVEVNRLAVTTKKETNGSNTNTIIKAEVTDNILAGKYLNDTKEAGSGELTLNSNLTTTANTIAGSYSSSADKAAEGGKIIIDGAYTATKNDNKIYAGYSENSDVKNNTIKLTANANVENTDLYGSNKETDGTNNNNLEISDFNGIVNGLYNFDNVNFDDIDFAKDDIEITSTEQSDLSNANLNVNFTTNGKIYDKGEVQQITLNNINIGSEGTKNSGDVIKEKTDGNGVEVNRLAVTTKKETNGSNTNTIIKAEVTDNILAGKYLNDTKEAGSGELTLNGNLTTTANAIAGSYSSSADKVAEGGKITIDGAYTATKNDNKIYAGYSENSDVKNNTIKLTANANVENTDLYGSNKETDGTNNNNLEISDFNGIVNGLYNFDNVNFDDIDFAKDDIEITSTEQSDLSNANLNVNFTTNGKIYDKGEVQQITLNNINIGSEGTKNSGDVIKEKTDGNGVEVNRLAVTTKKETNGSNTNTIIKAEVTDNILAGKYLNDTKEAGSGELTLNSNLTTTANTIAGSYSSSADKAAEGGKITIDGAYTATKNDNKIYAGYSENSDVKNNTIKLTANANVENTDLYGSNKETDGTNDNNLEISGFSGTVNSLKNFDNINIDDVAFADNAVVITAKNASDLSNAKLNATFTGYKDTIYAEGESKDIMILNNIKVNSNIANQADGDIIVDTDDNNGVEVNRLNLTAKEEQTSAIINATVTKHILAGKYTNNIDTYGDKENGKLVIGDGFNNSASTIAGSYASGSQDATGGNVVINGSFTTKTNDIYAGYSENGAVKDNTITLQANADIATKNLYGANDTVTRTATNKSENSLIIEGWSGKVNSLNNFDEINIKKADLDNTLKIESVVKSDLSGAKLSIDEFAVDKDTDLAVNDSKNIIEMKNISTGAVADDSKTQESIAETANGVRVHQFDLDADSQDSDSDTTITATVNKSVLAGRYTNDDASYGTGNLNIDDNFKTKANIVAGSYATGDEEATNGVITVDGSYNGSIYAGYSESGTGKVNNNSIILNDTANVENANLYGSNTGNTGNDSNNNLIVNGNVGNVQSVNNFNQIDFNNIEGNSNTGMLNIINADGSDLENTKINLNSIAGGQRLNAGDNLNVLTGNDALNIDSKNINADKIFEGTTGIVSGDAMIDKNGNIVINIQEVENNPQTNLVAENRAVASAFINQGSDLISDGLDSLSDQYGYGFKTFGAVYGNRSSYDVNSELKINGWSEIIGFGRTNRVANGDFDWGVFYENGIGNYRVYNEFNDEFFRGDGNLLYNGGGVLARLRQDNGLYYEASLRAGTLKSEMNNALKDGSGNFYGYESDSTYYGAHLGVGKILKLDKDRDLDIYGKFFHTYVDGDSFDIAGDRFEFDSVTSDRLRIGAKLTTNKQNKWSTIYGLAYEYEFNGDSDMRAGQFDMPTQSLKGGTVIGEIGLNYQSTKYNPWSFDLKLTGYQGQRDGFSGKAQITYNF